MDSEGEIVLWQGKGEFLIHIHLSTLKQINSA